jgi:hypothetical protein
MMQDLTKDDFTTPFLVLPRAARGRKEVGDLTPYSFYHTWTGTPNSDN